MLHTDSNIQVGVLSPDTFFHLLASNQINYPRISEHEIQDRSKGDAFAKTVASLQTFWFVAQIIGRGIQHLPVTELEIVTLGYAVLNGVVYFLWWYKPLNVACPVPVFLKPDAVYPKKQKPLPALPVDVEDISSNAIHTEAGDIGEGNLSRSATTSVQGPTSTDAGDPFGCIPYPLQILGGIILVPLIPAIALATMGLGLAIGAAALAFALAIAIPALAFAIAVLTISISTQAFLIPIGFNYQEMMFADEVADGALRVPTYYAYNPNSMLHDVDKDVQVSSALIEDLENQETREMKEDISDLGKDRLEYEDLDLLVCGGLSIVFGSIHCIAWYFHFPTSAERIVWRICAVSVTCMPAAVMLRSIIRLVALLRVRGEMSSSSMRTKGGKFGGSLLSNVFLGLCWNFYAFARLGLLVLAVIGLRNLPMTTFLAVRWAEFLPHYQ